MSPEEAIWLGKALLRCKTSELSPLINLGSSSEEYRMNACSEIKEHVFKRLADRGVTVYHADIKKEAGVDIVGNICDKRVQNAICAIQPKALLCNNILEHVLDRELFCKACSSLLPHAGLLFVSVPYKYPYHPDPIDTKFRPDIEELKILFSNFEFVEGEIISFGNYLKQLRAKKWLLIRDAYLFVAGIIKPDRWKVLFSNYQFFSSPYKVTCSVFRKI
jgi:hypothetical protein